MNLSETLAAVKSAKNWQEVSRLLKDAAAKAKFKREEGEFTEKIFQALKERCEEFRTLRLSWFKDHEKIHDNLIDAVIEAASPPKEDILQVLLRQHQEMKEVLCQLKAAQDHILDFLGNQSFSKETVTV